MTRFNNKYPYTDFHELNADWLLETVEDAAAVASSMDDRVTTLEGDISTITPIVTQLNSDMYEPVTGVKDKANNSWAVCSSNTNRIIILENDNITQGMQIGNLGYSLADPFRPEQAYSTGDYVIDDDTKRLYKAIVDIPAGTGDINDLTQFYPTAFSSVVGANELPAVTSADAGDVLTVDSNGDWVAATPSALPAVTSADAGDVLTVDSNGDWVAATPSALPAVTSADAGDVLTVDSNGDWVAATPGGGSTPITITGASNITIISNKSKRVGDTIIIDFSFSTDAIINANDFIVTTQFIAPGNAAPNYFVTQSNVPVSQRMLLNINGYLTTAESIAQGVTIVVNYRYEV